MDINQYTELEEKPQNMTVLLNDSFDVKVEMLFLHTQN